MKLINIAFKLILCTAILQALASGQVSNGREPSTTGLRADDTTVVNSPKSTETEDETVTEIIKGIQRLSLAHINQAGKSQNPIFIPYLQQLEADYDKQAGRPGWITGGQVAEVDVALVRLGEKRELSKTVCQLHYGTEDAQAGALWKLQRIGGWAQFLR